MVCLMHGLHGRQLSLMHRVLVCVCRNTIIPEIQATAKAPSVVTMNKAIYLLYAQLAVTYIPAALIGYACFGTLPVLVRCLFWYVACFGTLPVLVRCLFWYVACFGMLPVLVRCLIKTRALLVCAYVGLCLHESL